MNNKEVELKQISKEEFKVLSWALNWKKKLKCKYCKKKITEKNFGVLHADVTSCNDFSCQTFAINELQLKYKLK